MAWLIRIHHLKSLPGGRLENHQEDLQIEKRYCKNISIILILEGSYQLFKNK